MLNITAIKSIDTLSSILAKLTVPHTLNSALDGMQLRFPWADGDVIAHSYSIGWENGMVESYRFPWDKKGDYDDITVDTPERMAVRIACLYFGIEEEG